MSAALAEYGRKVLLVDYDPQGALSAGLGVNAHDAVTIYDLMLDRKIDPKTAIQHTAVKNLDVIPANFRLLR
jgi:chromosome partitioning protein